MKKISLVVLLGLALSAVMMTGCNDNSSTPAPSTNAAPAAPATPPSTNKM